MSRLDEVRLMSKVARLYYDQGIRQQDITKKLNVHQSTISRLLKRAREENIVRISVVTPPGIFSDLEDALEKRFHLQEAVVVDTSTAEEHMVRDLGAAAAFFVETKVKPGDVIGISSWSRALIAMVSALHPTDRGKGGKVVQILGGVGNPAPQQDATQLAQRLATLLQATPVLLQAPGIVGSAKVKSVLSQDPAVSKAAELFSHIDIALVGIGSMEPSKLLASSGNIFSVDERNSLRQQGAVGDICFRFFDDSGKIIKSPLNDRVIGIELEALRRTQRVVGIAGGASKRAAILGALRGQWIDVLITDKHTADSLLQDEPDALVSERSTIRKKK
jgi:DNA-binding transcriptional regulator LsrR (DeoR family)